MNEKLQKPVSDLDALIRDTCSGTSLVLRSKKHTIRFTKKPLKIDDFVCRKIPIKRLSHWPVEPGAYTLGNPLAPTAFLVGLPNPELNAELISSGSFCIAGHCLTANIGIEKILSNIVSNPNIRFIILGGEESRGHRSLDAFFNLWKNGVDKRGKIINAKGLTPYIKNLPKIVIERFQKQILYVINLIGEESSELFQNIAKCGIQEPENAIEVYIEYNEKSSEIFHLYDPGVFPEEPLIYSLAKKLQSMGITEIATGESVNIIAPTIAVAYPIVIDAILSAGRSITDERGAITKEVLGFTITILNPLQDRIPEGYQPISTVKTEEEAKEFLELYAKTFIYSDVAVSTDEEGKFKLVKSTELDYIYGERITRATWFSDDSSFAPPIDQLNYATDALENAIKKDLQTRRIGMVLLNPASDMTTDTRKKEGEIPCLTQILLYPRKENNQWKIIGHFIMRSWDAHRALPANLYGFSKLLCHIAKKVSMKVHQAVTVGRLRVTAGSAHVYLE